MGACSRINSQVENGTDEGRIRKYELGEMYFLGIILIGWWMVGLLFRYVSNPSLILGWYLLSFLWMLGLSIFWMRRRKIGYSYFRISKFPMLFAILCVPLALGCFALLFSPPSNGRINYPIVLEGWFILLSTIIAPIEEELFFRGLVLDHLNRNLGWAAAIIITSVLFGLEHIAQGDPLERFLLTFVLSLIWCWMALGFRNLILPISFHCLINTIITLMQMAPQMQTFTIATSILFIVALIVIGIVRRAHPYDVEDKKIPLGGRRDSFTWK